MAFNDLEERTDPEGSGPRPGMPRDPMAVHHSREHYFAALKRDPWGFANPAYDWPEENRFVVGIVGFYVAVLFAVGWLVHAGALPAFNTATLPNFLSGLALLYVGKCLFSWVVLRLNVKINYVRKLGLRPWKKLVAFLVPLLVTKGNSVVTDWLVLFSTQCLVGVFTEWNVVRRRVKVLAFAYLSWDRLEDRPYSMRYDQVEDLLRFAIYLPFMILFGESSMIVLIPNMVNQFGDGLAEPVRIRFGAHTYRARAIWYDGKFWAGNFTRSWEGSAAVFVVTLLIMALFHSEFTATQLVIGLVFMPPLMTLAEAISPHTGDGPLIALVGCLGLWGLLAI